MRRATWLVLAVGLAGCSRLVGIQDLEGADGGVDAPWTGGDASPADASTRDGAGDAHVGDGPVDAVETIIDAAPRTGDASAGDAADVAFDAARDGMVDTAPDAAACPPLVWHEATANIYSPRVVGACNYAPDTLPAFFAGLDDQGFDNARGCGTCLRVVAGDPAKATNSVDVLVVERVGGVTGQGRQLGLSRAAMDAVAPQASLTALWFAVVPCAPPLTQKNIRIAQKQGSNLQHLEIMIRDSRHPVTKVELKHDGAWKPMTLMGYNYWLLEAAGEDRIYDFQLTTADDEKLQVSQIMLTSTATQDGPLVDTGVQFASCRP